MTFPCLFSPRSALSVGSALTLVTGLFLNIPVWAGGVGHEHTPSSERTTAGAQEEHHGGAMEGRHRHGEWASPPLEYADNNSNRWTNLDAIKRGQRLYTQNCMSCHGVDGKGAGPTASTLQHPPADLTNHFHKAPGEGDAYLFWRVSEGGSVEPFKSMQSAMPAFKNTLGKEERWDVLAYVHAYFHLGLAEWKEERRAVKSNKSNGGHRHDRE